MFEGLKFLHSQPLDGSTCRLYSHIRHSLVGYNNFIHTYCLLKGYFLLTLKLFQTCMSFFLLLNAKEDILKNVWLLFFYCCNVLHSFFLSLFSGKFFSNVICKHNHKCNPNNEVL